MDYSSRNPLSLALLAAKTKKVETMPVLNFCYDNKGGAGDLGKAVQ